MNLSRRSILKSLPAVFIAGLVPSMRGTALTTLPAKPEVRELLLNRFFIAGFQFYDSPGLVGRLVRGTALSLRAEPKNKYDAFAVEILHSNTKLGYVPRTDNKHISRLLGQGAGLVCRVVEVDPGEWMWRMVRVEVLLT